jgi:hypothetical protein
VSDVARLRSGGPLWHLLERIGGRGIVLRDDEQQRIAVEVRVRPIIASFGA